MELKINGKDMSVNDLKQFIKEPGRIYEGLVANGFLNFLPDELIIRQLYRLKTGKVLNLENPRSFDEKIQWLKLHDRNPELTNLVDKYEVKKIVSEIVGDKYIIPTLGVWKKPEDINFNSLPDQFVLKCTHDSGGLIICKDKASLDKAQAIRILRHSFRRNYYYRGREWAYKNVKPKIIAEQYMEDSSGELNDYKVFNFDGCPKLIQVDYDRFTDHKRNLYTPDWKYIDASIKFPNDRNHIIPKPVCLQEMLCLASTLSRGFAHVRTDFYCIDDKLYFGEMTFYHGSGFEKFTPEEFGLEVGSWLKIPHDNEKQGE